jgi:hypothetical protein
LAQEFGALGQLHFDHSACKFKQAGLPDSEATNFPGAQGKDGYFEHLSGFPLREAEPLPPSLQFHATHSFIRDE